MPKTTTQWRLSCRAPNCGYTRKVGSEKERDRWTGIHQAVGKGHQIEAAEEIPLPTSPQVGDRVRLKQEKAPELLKACKAAGYDFDPETIVTIQREDFRPAGRALWFDRAPWSFYASDLELAWSSDQERREALREKGHDV